MSDCKGCANLYSRNKCRTMEHKPYDKWCYMTAEQAIEAEKAVIEYITKALKQQEFQPEEVRRLNIVRAKAVEKIKKLEV